MPALNFKAQFADDVESGEKHQTIRRGHRIKQGDRLYLYTGQRTKQCRKLGETVAHRVRDIRIEGAEVWIGAEWVPRDEREDLAHADGFNNLMEFGAFFKGTHERPFNGQLIEW